MVIRGDVNGDECVYSKSSLSFRAGFCALVRYVDVYGDYLGLDQQKW